MSTSNILAFPIERVVYIGNFGTLSGAQRMELSVAVTQDQKREVLRQIGATVDGETLARWIAEDLHMEVTE